MRWSASSPPGIPVEDGCHPISRIFFAHSRSWSGPPTSVSRNIKLLIFWLHFLHARVQGLFEGAQELFLCMQNNTP